MRVKRYVGVFFYVSLATACSARAQDKNKKEEAASALSEVRKAHGSSAGVGPVPHPGAIVYPLLDSAWLEDYEGIGGGDPFGEYEEEDDLLVTEEATLAYHFFDTTWQHRYYAIKDSRHVDPYKKPWQAFEDTVVFQLEHPNTAITWAAPLSQTVVTSRFGMRRHRWHYGVDLRLARGDTVYAASYGVVRLKKYQRRGFGRYILLHHYNGLETIYAHLSKSLVTEGQIVHAGAPIGLGGNTGRSSAPHLHFEVRYEGKPIDPNRLFDLNKGCVASENYTLTASDFAYLKKAHAVLVHRVRRGDTLIRIAQRYRTSVTRICRLNKISRRRPIYPNQKLRVR